jgi:ABC-type branched-subunit amino acid transport system substrate-binding protein
MKLRLVAPVAADAVTCIAFSGCSSHSGTAATSSGSATASSGVKLTGAPINIMGSAALSGTESPYPEVAGGMKAAVAQIDDAGGINGHPLNLTVCDTQGNPNIAQSCAQQAASSKDVAVLGPANLLTTSVIPTLQQAGIALVGADLSDTLDATSPISFPAVTGGYDLNDAVGAVAKEVECTKVGAVIIQAPDITQTIATSVSSSLKNVGIPYTGPATDPEASAAVAAVNKYPPGTAITSRSIEAWADVQLLAQALKSITSGTYDSKTVLAAMGSLKNATSGDVLPPYTTTQDNPVAGQERVFNSSIVVYQVEGTTTKTVSNWIPIPGVAPGSK